MRISSLALFGLSMVLLLPSAHGQKPGATLFRDLSDLGLQLSKEEDGTPGFFMIRTRAWDAFHAMKLPNSFRDKITRLDRQLKDHAFSDAANTAAQMEAQMPRQHLVTYPLSHDFLIRWRAEIGYLRSLGCDYNGAAREYELALKMTAIGDDQTSPFYQQAGKQSAAYGLAFVYGLLGRHEEALVQLRDAPGYYFSGCGNCEEGEQEQINRLSTVWAATSLPYSQAKAALARIIHGDYQPLQMKTLIGGEASFILRAKEEAAYALGELSFRNGDKNLAKACFGAVSKRQGSDLGRMAYSRLSKLLTLSTR